MKPASFDYHAPPTLAEAVELMARLHEEGVDAKILAGGQSLMPMLAMRVARPEVLVDLGKIKSLDYIREESGAIAIGAMTSKRAAEASALIERQQPLFHAATKLVGHRQIRNRGSVGGSFAHADPASEYPAVALVLDIVFKAVGPEGERTIPAGAASRHGLGHPGICPAQWRLGAGGCRHDAETCRRCLRRCSPGRFRR